MKKNMTLLLKLLLLSIPSIVLSYPSFMKLIPNGDKVKFEGESWPGVGHTKVYGGGDLNIFGKDFMNAGNEWTEELCRKDSDGDGRTNGEELGDPECTWKLGDPNPKTRFVTHPGIADECPSPSPAPSLMKIAIIGAGKVGQGLMKTFTKANFILSYGVRNLATHPDSDYLVKPVNEAIEWATVVFLAVPANAVLDIIKTYGESLKTKVIVDCTNPFTWDKGPVWSPPSSGSITAEINALLPKARVVKAFNTFGSEFHANPLLRGTPVQVFIAGDDLEAKKTVSGIAERADFHPVDAGPLRNAGTLENIAILWIHLATMGGKDRTFSIGVIE